LNKYGLYILTILIVTCLVVGKQKSDIQEGLDSCLENVQKSCRGIIEYAIMLENENAKLNKKIRLCLDSSN
jgi:hypothetical protein